jgi:alpha-tubulin suppressor-like RCC1 family protein
MWGSNKYGELGLGTFESVFAPTEVLIKTGAADESSDTLTVSVKDQSPIDIACGDNFTIVRTMSGALYSCGSNIQGQLGLGEIMAHKVNRLNKLSLSLSEDDICTVQASNFAACLLNSGELYLWGPTPVGHFNSPTLLEDR